MKKSMKSISLLSLLLSRKSSRVRPCPPTSPIVHHNPSNSREVLQVYKQDQYLYVPYYRLGNVSPGCDSSAAHGQQKPTGMSKFIPFRYSLD